MKKLVGKALVSGHQEAGQVTAEYAMGTVAVIGLGATLIGVIRYGPDLVPGFILEFVARLVQWIMGFLG